MKREHISFKEARLLVWELTENIETLQGQLNLVEADKTKLDKIVTEKRKLEFLGIRVALKTLLGKEIQIEYDLDGKPHLSDQSYQISISHSNKWIAVMAHPTRKVGVDIECPTDKIQRLYKRFLSITEQEELSRGEDLKQLLLAWSGKEALYKIIGKEAVDFANQLRIFPFEVKSSGEMKAQHIPTKSFYQLLYQQTGQYTLVYCLA
ncbi:MAG: 4'-phosphopantetheinyl transferase superfamily protein [Bacteroidota bacterium]|nr:4'-phosphopantetheinyl transferase superfamily protein [Bacteroidota bacterium]